MQPSPNETPKSRDFRLDIIKAISIILIVVWHLETFDISVPETTSQSINALVKGTLQWFYFQITLLGVPSFLIVSLYLYFRKLLSDGLGYFPRRLPHLIRLFVFWTFCQYLIFYLIAIPKTSTIPEQFAQLLPTINVETLFLNGGPSLPIVESSVFYFLSLLIQLTLLATLFHLIKSAVWLQSLLGGALILGSFLYFEIQGIAGVEIPTGQVQAFVLYIPIAWYLGTSSRKYSRVALAVLLAGYLIFSIQDYYLRTVGIPLNTYGRPSVVFGATALVYSIMNLKSGKEIKSADVLSRYSLGIYAVHKYFQYLSIITLSPYLLALGLSRKVPLGIFRVNLQLIIVTLMTVLLTALCIYILAKTPLKRFVS